VYCQVASLDAKLEFDLIDVKIALNLIDRSSEVLAVINQLLKVTVVFAATLKKKSYPDSQTPSIADLTTNLFAFKQRTKWNRQIWAM
jgi:hypothetical protein